MWATVRSACACANNGSTLDGSLFSVSKATKATFSIFLINSHLPPLSGHKLRKSSCGSSWLPRAAITLRLLRASIFSDHHCSAFPLYEKSPTIRTTSGLFAAMFSSVLVLSLKSPDAVKWNGVTGGRLSEPPPILTPSPPPLPSICGGGNGDGGCAVADCCCPPPLGCDDGGCTVGS